MKTDNTLVPAGPDRASLDEDRLWEPDGGRRPERKGLSVSSLLRGIGGLVVVAAFLMYLFQGWRDGDQLTRTLILLAHTGILTLAGFAAGHWIKDAKGARLFIALALIAIPVDFAFLGGITYDHLSWDPAGTASLATAWGPNIWQQGVDSGAMNAGSAIGLMLAALAALTVAIMVGFLVMARRSAGWLTWLYLLANSALLVPTRWQGAISGMLVILTLILTVASVRLRRRDASLATPEGVFARAVLLLPVLLLGGRSVWLYSPDGVFFASLALLGYLGVRLVLGATQRARTMLESCAVSMAGIVAVIVLDTLMGLRGLSDVWLIPATSALFAGLLVDLSRVVRVHATEYRTAAALVMAAALGANLALFGGLGNAAACVLLGLAGTVWGYTQRLRLVFAMGLIVALGGIGVGGRLALVSFSIGGWTALVIAGIATIAAGSIVERYGQRIRSGFVRWHRHFDPVAE